MWRVCMFLTMKIVSYQVLLMFYFNQRENLILNTGQLQVWNLKTLNFEMFIIGGRDKTVKLWSVRNIGEGDNQVCNWFIKIWTKFYCIILTYSTGCFAFPLDIFLYLHYRIFKEREVKANFSKTKSKCQ